MNTCHFIPRAHPLTPVGSALNIDPYAFQARLYTLLSGLPASGPAEWAAAIECVDVMLLRRREVSVHRVMNTYPPPPLYSNLSFSLSLDCFAYLNVLLQNSNSFIHS